MKCEFLKGKLYKYSCNEKPKYIFINKKHPKHFKSYCELNHMKKDNPEFKDHYVIFEKAKITKSNNPNRKWPYINL